MTSMFANCDSLSSLPNISKWNMSKVDKKEGMFPNKLINNFEYPKI